MDRKKITRENIRLYQETKDKKYRNKVIEDNLGLVYRIVNKYYDGDEDLYQEGVFGLATAIEKFDLNKKIEFSTYANFWIFQKVSRAYGYNRSLLSIPFNKYTLYSSAKKAALVLEQKYGREATEEEIAKFLNASEEDVKEVLICYQTPASLDKTFNCEEEKDNFYSILGLTPSFESMLIDDITYKEIVEKLFSTLDDKEKEVIKLRYGFYNDKRYTLEEIAKRIGRTLERARQIEKVALQKMKRYFIKVGSLEETGFDNKTLAEILMTNYHKVREALNITYILPKHQVLLRKAFGKNYTKKYQEAKFSVKEKNIITDYIEALKISVISLSSASLDEVSVNIEDYDIAKIKVYLNYMPINYRKILLDFMQNKKSIKDIAGETNLTSLIVQRVINSSLAFINEEKDVILKKVK